MPKQINFILGDITKIEADAIVNAANNTMLGGGGVDDAIHKLAGPELYKECLKIGPCPTGEARITKGYNLPSKHIIHAVGPMWFDRDQEELKDQQLAQAYLNSLKLAETNELKTIAFPSISTGAFGFPIERAAPIAIKTVMDFLKTSQSVNEVTFVLFSPEDLKTYEEAYQKLI